jgi:aldehyde:ferredoxin oxidoreductase
MWQLRNLTGNVLSVDLSTGEIRSFEGEPDIHRSFLGGRGLNQYFLYRQLTPSIRPFDPESLVTFGAGLLSGTALSGATRSSIDGKSAFSGGVGSANAGEDFAPALKRAGYATVMVTGKAENPVYLWINDDTVRIVKAGELRGKTTNQVVDSLRKIHGEDIQVACIGPAGENRVRGASVIINKGRAAGKCGLGAVMGSKNLKAVAVRGTGMVRVARPEEYRALCRDFLSKITESKVAKRMSAQGTKSMKAKNEICAIASRHFQDGHMETMDGIDLQDFAPYEIQRLRCPGCPVSCRQIFKIDSGPYAGAEGEAIEGNSIQDFGAKLNIRDAPALIKAHILCNELGMDIDMAAESIAWAFECYEKGLLTHKDTDGLELTWGNHATLMTLIEQIAFRKGLGDTLARGTRKAAEIIGRGSGELAVHMKGQDLYEDMRIPKGYALGVALSTRGGGHCSGSPLMEFSASWAGGEQMTVEGPHGFTSPIDPAVYDGKAHLVAYHECVHAILNSLGLCFFVSAVASPELPGVADYARLISAAADWDIDPEELMEAGERIHTVERLFNLLHAGFDRKDDYPVERFFRDPIKTGPYKGEILHRNLFDRMLDENYEIHGWDKRGRPKRRTLEKLRLTSLLDHFPL